MEQLQFRTKFYNSDGQALIEIIVAIAVAALVLPGILTGLVSSREGKLQESQRIKASAILLEMAEAVRNMRAINWDTVATNGTFHPVVSGSVWAKASGGDSIENFSRQYAITSVQRDINGNIVESGGTEDPSTKKVTYLVSWTNPSPGSIDRTEYLTRYVDNTTVVQTSTSDFDAGSHTNTVSVSTGGGAVELQPPAAQSGTFTDNYDTASNYTYNSSSVEVTGGYAQLKNIGGPVSGALTNTGFNTNATGWTVGRWGDVVSTTGNYVATGGNPGGYVNLSFPSTKNKITGAYWYQAITTTASNPSATLSFQYRVTAYSATPDSFRLYVYLDTASGTPTNQVWSSSNITGTSTWSGTVNVNVASSMINPGTYYVKVAAYVDYPSTNKGPYTVGYDNVNLAWSGTANAYASNSPTIYPNQSFSQSSITGWTSFAETSVLNGGSIMYQLSDDNGATWKYFAGGASTNWVTATSNTQYNDAVTINQKISGFPVTNHSILVKAFLISNGTQQVKLDKIDIGYVGSTGVNTGTFISQAWDIGKKAGFNHIYWSESNTANTTTQLQIASNNDNATWNFVGPDGTGSSYFTNGSGVIPLNQVEGRYLKYKIEFRSTNSDIPRVSDVTVNYSP